MKIILLTVGLLTSAYFFTKAPDVDFQKDSSEGIAFHKGTWSEALAQAKMENKPIFLDIYASWCGPCKRLKAYTFSDKEVGTYYNQSFINVAYDGEKGEGISLAQKFGLTSYPSLFFFDSSGKPIAKSEGYHDSDDFLEMGEKVVKSIKK